MTDNTTQRVDAERLSELLADVTFMNSGAISYPPEFASKSAWFVAKELPALLQQLAEAERAREEACGLLRNVIAWRRTVSIDETPNRNDGGISGRIAAFLAANGEQDHG